MHPLQAARGVVQRVTLPDGRVVDLRIPEGLSTETLKASPKAGLNAPLAIAMLLEGVDLFSGGGLVSYAHTAADIDFTIEAFDRSLSRLRAEGLLA